MNMIRIAKMPYLTEDTDRWGWGLGTYSVVDVQGYMEDQMWNRVQEFEGYYLSVEDKTKASLHGIGIDSISEMLPYMKKVLAYTNNSLIWEFNLFVSQLKDPSEAKYLRSYAVFGEKTLHEWTPEHDVKVALLKEEAKGMSK